MKKVISRFLPAYGPGHVF